MDPDRKRKIRLVVALGAAVLLAAGLVYTSFSAGSETVQPSELQGASGGNYKLTGEVAEGSVQHDGSKLLFVVADREDPTASIPVTYSGQVPDPFREGREVIVSGTVENGMFVGEKDSLITKCPSKFAEEAKEDPEHVVIDESS
jgi:cytochrome c-type biogenesis protein CcmE